MRTPETTTTIPVPEPLDEYRPLRSELNERINETVVSTDPPELRTALLHATSDGKRIRPMLTLISCAAVGGRPEEAMPAAAAVELLHASSLVHDDIMDRAEMRRSKLTVHALFGTERAILTGDLLIALAYRSLSQTDPAYLSDAVRCFTDGFIWTCEGQGMDVSGAEANGHRPQWATAEKKTARLIEAAAALGGIIGRAKQVQLQALRGFALSIGLAYQAQDDLLDATGSPEQTGKSVGLDRRNGRTTFASNDTGSVGMLVSDYTARAYSYLDMLPESRHRANLGLLAESLVGRVK